MDPRDGIALWRLVREQRGAFAGPFSFMMLAQRYWPTSAVIESDDEVVGYLLARRDDDALRIVDCEVADSETERDALWELLQTAVGPHDDLAYVDLPCALDDRIRRGSRVRHDHGPALAKAGPPMPSVMRSRGPSSVGPDDDHGACALA